MNNSIKEIINVLEREQFLSENEITRRAFGYDRNTNWSSNKKYAEMIRRALRKGLLKRVEYRREGKYFYYTPKKVAS